jgi:hypothetical protein
MKLAIHDDNSSIHDKIAASMTVVGGQDSFVGKAFGSQAKRYWVRSSPRPQNALKLSD